MEGRELRNMGDEEKERRIEYMKKERDVEWNVRVNMMV